MMNFDDENYKCILEQMVADLHATMNLLINALNISNKHTIGLKRDLIAADSALRHSLDIIDDQYKALQQIKSRQGFTPEGVDLSKVPDYMASPFAMYAKELLTDSNSQDNNDKEYGNGRKDD